MNTRFFLLCYFVFLGMGSFIRVYFKKRYSREDITQSYSNSFEFVLMVLPSLGMFFLPLIMAFTNWLVFADYLLPAWCGITGCMIFIFSLWLLFRSHADLNKNWSPLLEIRKKHEIVTDGVFRYIRHPMYAAHFGWGVAQILLLWNWIVGSSMLILMLPLYFYRVKKEEKMMLQHFAEYEAYKKRTGRIFPKIKRG